MQSCSEKTPEFQNFWIEKIKGVEQIHIQKSGNDFIVNIGEKKYPAKSIDGFLKVSSSFPMEAMINGSGNLILNGKEYVPAKKSKRALFFGEWQSQTEGSYGFCKFRIFNKNERMKVQMIDMSCYPFTFKLQNLDYNDGTVRFRRKQFLETGRSEYINGNMEFKTENTIRIYYDGNIFPEEIYVKQFN